MPKGGDQLDGEYPGGVEGETVPLRVVGTCQYDQHYRDFPVHYLRASASINVSGLCGPSW